MAPLFNLTQGKTLKGITIGALSLSMIGASFTMPASFAAENSAQKVDTEKTLAKQIQGIAGQYQIAHSKNNNKVFVAGSDRTMGASTLARLDATSMKVEAVAGLPVTRSGTGYEAGYSSLAAFGITVDDVNNTVWVTNTRNDSVSVYDQNTLKLLWTNYTPGYEGTEAEIEHPRDVKIDHATGKAYVTGRYYISSIDLKTHEVKKLRIDPDASGRVSPMNMNIDGDKMYVPVRSSDTVKIIDLKSFSVEKEYKVHADVAGKEVRPSDSVVDHSTNELYVSSQGLDGANSGVTVYDLNTGEYKKSIPFGEQALAMVNDDERDLVYVTDFKTGKVGVIDTRSSQVIGEVQAGAKGANDITIGAEGEVYVANKDGYVAEATVPYAVDRATGDYTNSTQSVDSITKVKVSTTEGEAPKPDPKPTPAPETQTVTTDDGASLSGVKVARVGQEIVVSGSGWKDKNGGGSVAAVKLDGGAVVPRGQVSYGGKEYGSRGVVAVVEADDAGNFVARIPFPSADNSNVKGSDWGVGSKHTVTFLSGSLKVDGGGKKVDVVRSAELEVTVGEAAAAPAADAPKADNAADAKAEVAKITPRQAKFEGYPPVTPTDPDKSLAKVNFKDIDSNPFKAEINFIAEKGITTGWSDGTYRPGDKIERGAMAAYLYRLAGSPRYEAPAESPFKDVKTTDPFYKEIAWLQSTGITTGWSDGTFRPNETVNRDAMAAFFYRAAGSPEYTNANPAKFSDVQDNPFAKEIAWLEEQGITTGWPDGTFRPGQAIDRDAMAAFIARYMKKFDHVQTVPAH